MALQMRFNNWVCFLDYLVGCVDPAVWGYIQPGTALGGLAGGVLQRNSWVLR
jgi:hypothetical protein